MHRGARRKPARQRFGVVGHLYSGRFPFPILGLTLTLEMRSDSDGWIKTVTEIVNTNRVHRAVSPRQVQMNQAVGLGQEQVQVLQGKKESVIYRMMKSSDWTAGTISTSLDL